LISLTFTVSLYYRYSYSHHRHLHSFPTRRSSDLEKAAVPQISYPHHKLIVSTTWTTSGRIYTISSFAIFVLSGRLMISVFFLIPDRKSTRLNSSHVSISYAVFCLKKKRET